MKINNITKKYGEKVVFEGFAYLFKDGEINVIMGESGCGKTTLLNIITNNIEYSGEVEAGTISMIYDDDRLVPNLTVEQNLKLVNPNIDIDEILEEVGLTGTKDMYPIGLSAGMSRRVSILRALIYDADYLVMDEPFVNLDYYTKYKMMDLIKSKYRDMFKAIIMVTHDITEATYMGDNIGIIDNPNAVNHYFEKITKDTEKKILNILLKK